MRGKQTVDLSQFTNISSSQLLILLHEVKAGKDIKKADLIAQEFTRRDLVAVNESILGKAKEHAAPIIETEGPKLRVARKVRGCDHCFCMTQGSLFDSSEVKICCRCDKESSV